MRLTRANIILCLLLGVIAWLLILGVEFAAAQENLYQTKLATIYYENEKQLEEFAKNIRPGSLTRVLNKIFLGKNAKCSDGDLAELVDTLFRRVQLALDMRQPKLKVNIRLHANRESLHQAYVHTIEGAGAEALGQTKGKTSPGPIAFYWKQTNTIHLQPEKLTIGVLAHEMGHATIDHNFVIRPPPKIAEMLCQYVDKEISADNF